MRAPGLVYYEAPMPPLGAGGGPGHQGDFSEVKIPPSLVLSRKS